MSTPHIAHLDFETYSAVPGGLEAAGAEVYFEHPSSMIRCAAYDLNDGRGIRSWVAEPVGDLFHQYPTAPPADLFDHVRRGGLIAAWNSRFEELAWARWPRHYNAPPVHPGQWVDTMAHGQAYGLPGSLKLAAQAMRAPAKIAGEALIKLFSCPPFTPFAEHPKQAAEFVEYNRRDVEAEKYIFWRVPILTEFEKRVWQVNHKISARGAAVDMRSARHLQDIVDAAKLKYNAEIMQLTGGAVESADKVRAIQDWAAARGCNLDATDATAIKAALADRALPPDVRRVLEIRKILGKKSVEKLGHILARGSTNGRARGLLQYYGAEATGRFAGRGPQPQNLPGKTGHLDARTLLSRTPAEVLATEADPVAPVSRALRSLFVPADGCEFIDVDYSAIEAVVLAEIAGEEWRREVFRTHGKIYEASAAKIAGIPVEEILDHKRRTGDHHPLRSRIGKPAELASGYGGGVKAWKRFGADKYLSDKEIAVGVKAWRAASPAIVNFWYAVERAAVAAIKTPGEYFPVRASAFYCYPDGGPLCCVLPSSRCLYYHYPRIEQGVHPYSGAPTERITFESRDLQKRWRRGDTYGGKLVENIVQAAARDILAHAVNNLDAAGLRVVLHVHDEVLIEAPRGSVTVADVSRIMLDLPGWAREYPLRADGWIGDCYKKD